MASARRESKRALQNYRCLRCTTPALLYRNACLLKLVLHLHTGVPKKFDFIEKEPKGGFDQQPGFVRFLRDTSPRSVQIVDPVEALT